MDPPEITDAECPFPAIAPSQAFHRRDVIISALPTLFLLLSTAVSGALLKPVYKNNLRPILYVVLAVAITQSIALTVFAIQRARRFAKSRAWLLIIPLTLALLSSVVVLVAITGRWSPVGHLSYLVTARFLITVISVPLGVLAMIILVCVVAWFWREWK